MKLSSVITTGLSMTLVPLWALEFEADILPIFSAKCAKCHMDGEDKGSLSLDIDEIDREIGPGKSISPGEPDKSDLLELVSLPDDDDDKMPPEGKGRPLSAGEIAKLKEWIESGASIGSGSEEMTETEAPGGVPSRPDPIEGSWTNSDGKVIKATLMRVDGDKAVLRMNGKEFPYPIASLSAESQAIVKEFSAAMNAAAGG